MKVSRLVIFSFLLCSLFTSNLSAQELNKELGFRLQSFTNFGFFFKKEKEDNSFMRYRLGSLRLRTNIVDDDNSFLSSAFVSIGVEYREPLAEKLTFLHGPEGILGISYQSSKNGQTNISANTFSISPTIGYVLGALYDFNDKTFIGMEIIPGLGIDISGGSNRDVTAQLDFLASINSVSLLVGYRF